MTHPAIPEVGFVDGLDPDVYHAHPALSSTMARLLLPPKTPAHYRWALDHPRPPKRAYDIGHAAHRLILGRGAEIVTVDADSYRTKAAQQARDDAHASGATPLLPHEMADASAMAAAVLAHEDAGVLMREGVAERALFWIDEDTGVACRAMVDWQPSRRALVDIKTTTDANPAALWRHIVDYGYDISDAHYLDGALALDLVDPDCEFVWIFVEKTPPHLVSVARLSADDLAYARERVALAREILRDCREADFWPGYPRGIKTVTLPSWSRRSIEEETPEW